MTAGDVLRANRARVCAFFPAAPDLMSVVEDAGESQIRFVDLQPSGIPNYRYAPGLTIDEGIAVHEEGHELEAQLVRAGDTQDALRTALWFRRGFPGTWQQSTADAEAGVYGPVGSNGWWGHLAVEVVAESISRSILGAPWTERHAYSYIPIDHDGELRWWQDRFAARGVEVPAVRTYTFSLNLAAGKADRIGGYNAIPAVGGGAMGLLESQRASLRLISGQGRKYGVDLQRVGLTGTETSLPDARAWVEEDTAIAVGANYRWKLNAMVRADFGAVGWYEARFDDVTAAI